MIVRIAATLALALTAATAAAQNYPARTISIIVPLSVGGGTDVLARVVAGKLRDKFGQPVTVENKPGAGGNIGADAVARAAPDGYTLMFTQPGPLVVNKALYARLTYDPDQFVPIALVSHQDILLAVNPGYSATSFTALVATPGTPAPVARKLAQALAEIVRMPDIQTRLAEAGDASFDMSPVRMAAFLDEERQRWSKLIRTVGVTAQ